MKVDPNNIDSRNFKEHFDRDTLWYVTEDVRLSTLQKKLAKETNANTALALACQISESIMYPDNRTYVQRSFEIICEAIVDIFYGKHSDPVKRESANALGKVGHVSSGLQDYAKFYKWLWDGFTKAKKDAVQVLHLKALAAFIKMRPSISEQDLENLVQDVQDVLEKTESEGIMMAVAIVLADLSRWKPKTFEPYFQNVVDILVGWHIDSSQSPTARTCISTVLLSWHSLWIIDMEFSSSLLKRKMRSSPSPALLSSFR